MYMRPRALVQVIEKGAVELHNQDNSGRDGHTAREEIRGGKIGGDAYRAIADGFYD